MVIYAGGKYVFSMVKQYLWVWNVPIFTVHVGVIYADFSLLHT